jgi:hypothetical protein
MLWFCSGHFVATWLVCLALIFRFQSSASGHSLAFVLFALLCWPVVLELLTLKGYFALKRVTLDRLKARVRSGELKKAVVFAFGFCASLLAAAGIGGAVWAVGSLDRWFGKMNGWFSALHTIAWFPLTFALWVIPPMIVLALLAGKNRKPAATTTAKTSEPEPAHV